MVIYLQGGASFFGMLLAYNTTTIDKKYFQLKEITTLIT